MAQNKEGVRTWYVIEEIGADGDTYDVIGEIEAEEEQAPFLAAQYYEKPKSKLLIEEKGSK